MAKAPKMCFDKILPQDLRRRQQVARGPGGRQRAIALRDKPWINGSTIRIRFMEGTEKQKDMVKEIAPEWTNHANLQFVFTDDPRAEIRVTFDPNDGAWSYVGTDNLSIPLHAATLNLGWQDEGVILHEFGHMIGLSHEHQNPDGGLQWNEPVVIAALAGPPNFWSEETTRHNVLNKYSADQLNGTEFDPDSVMLYSFPAEWTLNGVATHENEKLSDLDRSFVASSVMYPGGDSPEVNAVELAVATSIEAEISVGGEEDLYKFDVDEAGVHVITTLGATDLVMSLFGPDSETNLVATDDDGGAGANPLVSAELQPGTYYVQVRHFKDDATGSYRILVTR